MFLVNKEDKTAQEIKDVSFKSCGLKERNDLQEWIANNPIMLGEELLIIQKEFDGFLDTNERLDLLAIDKGGNLVIIENKLDDSGRNVVWHTFLPKFNEKSKLFAGRNIELNQYDHWFGTGSGISGVHFNFLIAKNYAGVELSISGGTQDENKKFFDYLYKNKGEIGREFGNELTSERLDDKKMSRVICRLEGVSVYNKDDWNKMMKFLTDNMIKLEKALRKFIDSYSKM